MYDTLIHLKACKYADDESFRLYGTDSISDKHILWPRWLGFYDNYLKRYYSHGS